MIYPTRWIMKEMEISQRINPPPAPPRGAGALIHVTSPVCPQEPRDEGRGRDEGKFHHIAVTAKWSSPRRWITSHAEREKANHPVV